MLVRWRKNQNQERGKNWPVDRETKNSPWWEKKSPESRREDVKKDKQDRQATKREWPEVGETAGRKASHAHRERKSKNPDR